MKTESGQLVVQPGSNPVLRQLVGWKGCLIWAKVTIVSDDTFPDEEPVRFTCARESGGTKVTSACGVLVAGPYSTRSSAQVITVGDYAELLLPRAFLRASAPWPVLVEWVAVETEVAPRAAVADYDSFVPVGSGGSAATPRVDPWGRTLVAPAPPGATWHISRELPVPPEPYSGFLLHPDEIAFLAGRSRGNGYTDKLDGQIAITRLSLQSSSSETVTINKCNMADAGVSGGGIWRGTTEAGGDGYQLVRTFDPPLLAWYSWSIGFPQITITGEVSRIEASGYLLLQPQTSEGDP